MTFAAGTVGAKNSAGSADLQNAEIQAQALIDETFELRITQAIVRMTSKFVERNSGPQEKESVAQAVMQFAADGFKASMLRGEKPNRSVEYTLDDEEYTDDGLLFLGMWEDGLKYQEGLSEAELLRFLAIRRRKNGLPPLTVQSNGSSVKRNRPGQAQFKVKDGEGEVTFRRK